MITTIPKIAAPLSILLAAAGALTEATPPISVSFFLSSVVGAVTFGWGVAWAVAKFRRKLEQKDALQQNQIEQMHREINEIKTELGWRGFIRGEHKEKPPGIAGEE